MASPQNRAAYLDKAATPLQVRDAPMPTPGPGEIVVKNAAVAINPLDWHMLDRGDFIQQWPAIFGCDIAGETYAVGPDVTRFKKGDRVIAHTVHLITSKPQDGAFQLYTVVPVNKAAILPDNIPFTDGAVIPIAFESAVCALCLRQPGEVMPGVPLPTLKLPYPSAQGASSLGKTLVVYGGASSVGNMATQVATAVGIQVISIAGARSFDLAKRAGAAQVFDYKDSALVQKVVAAVRESGNEFIGIFDSIGVDGTFAQDVAILEKLGGGHLAATHPPPATVPANVEAGMIFGVNDVATPAWTDFVTPALQAGTLKCLPPATIFGKGLEQIQGALEKCRAGVSGTKLVVEL